MSTNGRSRGQALRLAQAPDLYPMPPQNPEAEQGTLAGLLRGFDVGIIRSIIRPDDFFVGQNQVIYRGILAMADEGLPIDPMILADRLEASGQLRWTTGDKATLTVLDEIALNVPHTARTAEYACIVAEKARERDFQDFHQTGLASIQKNEKQADQLLDEARRRLDEIQNRMIATGRRVTVPLSEIEPRSIQWLWPDVVPMSKLTLFAGPGGIGKSYAALDMAARVSTGHSWPYHPDVENPVGSVVLISSEDDLADTTVRRLTRLGADLSRIHAFAGVELGRFLTLSDCRY